MFCSRISERLTHFISSLPTHSAPAMNRVTLIKQLFSNYKKIFLSQRLGFCQFENMLELPGSPLLIHTPNFRHFHLLPFSHRGLWFTPKHCFHLQRILSACNDISISDTGTAPKNSYHSTRQLLFPNNS